MVMPGGLGHAPNPQKALSQEENEERRHAPCVENLEVWIRVSVD